jgi:radical SAM superfamily enzyme YgiQ (UPF0313 family)
MQPLAGVHIGSLIDPDYFDVVLHHEDWHGPFEPMNAVAYDIAFLTGLQPDFDRMRQLSYHLRRAGVVVVAGGSIATLFPEFAARFFDVVCAGGVESVRAVIKDFLFERLKPIYSSPITSISKYDVDYALLAHNRINVKTHLLEASRGCSFRCSFCVIPAEVGGYANYQLDAVKRAVDNAIRTSPPFSFRRHWPIVLFLDNNLSDDTHHLLAIAELMRTHPRVRAWGALVTQNILRNRTLIDRLAKSKCRALFVGLESLDRAFLHRFNKRQNLGRNSVIEEVAAAERAGITIGYGYLFDPRYQTIAEMEAQLQMIARIDAMSMPVYLSLVAPLAGTALFWDELIAGRLAPNLRLRDLDGETIAYSTLADSEAEVSKFVDRVFRRPWEIIGRRAIARKIVRRLLTSRTLNPIDWYIRVASSMHCFAWARAYPSRRHTYIAGEDVLDPQYGEYPFEISQEDRSRYFEPIAITDASGAPTEWLRPYLDQYRSRSAGSVHERLAGSS